jgi:predicted nucleic acid-binding protein
LRIVVDTNVIVSAIYDPDSVPGRVLDAGITGHVLLCAPEAVRDELRRVLRRVLGFSAAQTERTVFGLPVDWIEEGVYRRELPRARRLLRDPTDAPVLACGLALGCDIVTGDHDLQVVRLAGIRVWTPAELARGD